MEMMVGMSRLADEYGLDVWIWYPAMDKDYSDPKTVEFALSEWGEVFQKLPRIDAIFVPGGDPGHTQPKHLMALLEKQTRTAAPLSSQGPDVGLAARASTSPGWTSSSTSCIREEPAWLSGVVFGPQVRVSLPELREAIPARIRFATIPTSRTAGSASIRCPTGTWRIAVTRGREVHQSAAAADRPRSFALLQPYTIGFLTYSEGCNDDVNKAVWSGLGWNPNADVVEFCASSAATFIGDSMPTISPRDCSAWRRTGKALCDQ